ncbi:MAG: RES family NAD+ phosphorylase [Bacteroidetes bacterium]|nr:RES family NAD+ phosphorylase [Bacteroidota bacterium]
MSKNYCCAKCFSDKGLKTQIIPRWSDKGGDCSFCKTKNQPVVEPGKLSEYFEVLIDVYQPDENGRLLIEWLKEDWLLFEHLGSDENYPNALLGEILDNREIIHQKFVPLVRDQTELVTTWGELTTELMFSNRFFPDTDFEYDRLEDLFANLIFDQSDHSLGWFRARIEEDGKRYEPSDMGAPPKRVASHGRANPAGIPYLYLGSTAETAVAEVRPHPGQSVCVAEFQIESELRLVDLRNPRSLISPFSFLLGDEESVLSQLRSGDIKFLESLGQDLAVPITPTAAAVDYTKSQYLCEFIKKSQYQGVIYNSSVSEGSNLALFNPDKATIGQIIGYQIKGVSVDMEPR